MRLGVKSSPFTNSSASFPLTNAPAFNTFLNNLHALRAHENKIVLSIHFQFNILGSEATSLFEIGRWTFDVGRSFEFTCLWARLRLLQEPRLQRRNPMKTQSIILSFIIWVCIFLSPAPDVMGVESAPRISDREIIEFLMRLEAGIQANAVAIQSNAEAIKANREMIGTLRTEMKSDIASFRTEITGFLLWGFGLLFTGMLILVGFILWDRRSTLKPVKDEIDDLKERKVDRIIAALKKLSEDDARFAQVLRSVGLL